MTGSRNPAPKGGYLSSFVLKLRSLLWGRQAEVDMVDEIAFHIEMETQKNIRDGLSPETAKRQAIRAFGGIEQHKEDLREGRSFVLAGNLVRDFRLALRSLRRSPVFFFVAVLTLGLGIGVTTSIFAAVKGILIQPLPFSDSHRLIMVESRHLERGISRVNISYPDYLSWKEDVRSFESLGVFAWWSGALGKGKDAQRIEGALVSPDLFAVLGIEPMLGRGFVEQDGLPGSESVLILGYELWQRTFGGRLDVIGSKTLLDQQPHTVVGVMPRGFEFPSQGEAWAPLVPGEQHLRRQDRFLAGAVGRLAEKVSLGAAREEMAAVSKRLQEEEKATNDGWDVELQGLRDALIGPLGPSLVLLQVATGLLLLVVCGNLGVLTIARALSRRRELWVRAALGAGRSRLAALLLTESLAIAICGALVALPVSIVGIVWMRSSIAPSFGDLAYLEADGSFALFACLAAGMAALGFGFLPAVGASRFHLRSGTDAISRSSGGRGSTRLRSSFVFLEVFLAVLLLIGAGLLLRSTRRLDQVDAGLVASGVLTARLSLPEVEYPDHSSRLPLIERVVERLATMPGVETAGAAQGVPFSGWNIHNGYHVEGEPELPEGQWHSAHVQSVTPGFLEALGVRLESGRWFEATDGAKAEVILINEALAERHFGTSDPIGRRIHFGEDLPTVIGVVSDFRHIELTEPMGPAAYFPLSSFSASRVAIVLKLKEQTKGASQLLRTYLAEVAPGLPPYQVEWLDEILERQSFYHRLVRNLLVGFAVSAAFLSMIGLYGVISHSTTSRRQELGIRTALGASPRRLVVSIMAQGLSLAVAGIVLAAPVSLGLGRFLEHWLFEVEPNDPLVYVLVFLSVSSLALIATWLPAFHALGAKSTRSVLER